MMKWSAYFRLMRFHKPVGIWLLWWPTAWALWVANHGAPPISLLIYFFSGTVLMRAAGCVINDMADRKFDRHVKRTAMRPLTTGEVSLWAALVLLGCILLIALIIVMQLPEGCFYYALAALGITILYPFCKRFFQAPQLVLGVAFSMGIPMVFVASQSPIDHSIWLLIINFCWIIAYDTMYAMVDREDDLRIGIKSTAILFADLDRFIILLLQACLHGFWIFLALQNHYSWRFYILWLANAGFLVEQQLLVNTRLNERCFKAFTLNAWYGFGMWVALMVG